MSVQSRVERWIFTRVLGPMAWAAQRRELQPMVGKSLGLLARIVRLYRRVDTVPAVQVDDVVADSGARLGAFKPAPSAPHWRS